MMCTDVRKANNMRNTDGALHCSKLLGYHAVIIMDAPAMMSSAVLSNASAYSMLQESQAMLVL